MATRDPKGTRLEDIRIASPCEEPWSEMVGDDRQRHCGRCDAKVYDVANMTRAAADDLLASTSGRLCLKLAWRRDGRVVTSDCPAGRQRIRLTRVVAVTAGGLLAALAALSCSKPPDPTPAAQLEAPAATVAATPSADVAPPVPAVSADAVDPAGTVATAAPVASASVRASASPRPPRGGALGPPKRRNDRHSMDEFLRPEFRREAQGTLIKYFPR